MPKGLEYVRDLSWEEVFGFWRENEGEDSKWRAHAEERGFASWEEWRKTYVPPLRLMERDWSLYRVTSPAKSIPGFRGGPFRGWIANVYGDTGPMPTFKNIAPLLDEVKGDGAREILKDFPKRTVVTGVLAGGDVVIVEGMHRCSAIAIAATENRPIETELLIALGSDTGEPLPNSVGGHRKGESPSS